MSKGKSGGIIPDELTRCFECLPVPFLVFSEKKVIYANKKALKTLKIPLSKQKDISAFSIYDFIIQPYDKIIRDLNKRVLNGLEPLGAEIKVKDYKGNILDVESKADIIELNGKIYLNATFREITNRKKVQEQLLQQKDELDLILNNIDYVVYYVTIENGKRHVKFVSRYIETVFGISPEDYEKKQAKLLRLVHPDDVQIVINSAKSLFKDKKAICSQYRFFNKRLDRYVWIEERIFPQLNEKKEVIGNFGLSRCVDEEKETERKLQESEKKYRLLAENASDIIFHVEFLPRPHYTFISPSVEKILGYPPENFYRDPTFAYSLIHPDDKHLLGNSEDNIRAGKRKVMVPDAITARYITADKKIVWLDTTYSVVSDKKGNIIAMEGISRDVSRLKEKEQLARDSQKTLSTLLNNLPGMAYRCLFDKNWTMEFISQGCLEITGYSPSDLIQNKIRSYASLVHPEDKIVGKKEIDFALKKKKSFEIEYRIIHRNGDERWVWEKGEGVFDEKGKLLFLEGFITDITQRKFAELELNQEWLNYRQLVDNLPIGIFIHDAGKIVLANAKALEIVEDLSGKKALKKNLVDFIVPEQRAIAIERIKRSASGEKLDPVEYKIKTIRGTEKLVKVGSYSIIFNGKKISKVTVEDISLREKLFQEQARAEMAEEVNRKLNLEIAQRKRSETTLRETQKYLRLLIDSSLDMIVATDSFGRVTEFNLAAQQVFGYTPEEILGKDVSVLFKDKSLSVFTDMVKHNSSFEGEIINLKKNGTPFYSLLAASLIRDERGEVIGSVGISRDITRQKQQEQELKQKEGKLSAIFESTDHLIWTVGRDMELTSFNQNYADVVRQKHGSPPVLYRSFDYFIPPETIKAFKEEWYPKFRQVFNGQSLKFEKEETDANGNLVYREIYLDPIYNEKGSVSEVSCIAHDITEQRLYERQSAERNAKLQAIFNSSTHMIWTVDKRLALTSYNQNFFDRVKNNQYAFHDLEGKPVIGKSNIGHNSDIWLDNYKLAFEGKSRHFELKTKALDGSEWYTEVFLEPVYSPSGEVTEVSGIAHDVTEKRNAEIIIRQNDERNRAFLDAMPDLLLRVNSDGVILFIHQKEGGELKTPPHLLLNKNIDAIYPEISKAVIDKIHQAIKTNTIQTYEHEMENNSTKVFYEARIARINNSEVILVVRNITDSKLASVRMEASLREKEVLLKEIHHRVKNNLQVISSILNLQSSYLKDQQIIQILKECQNRIKSMAFIHESLYQNKDFTNINFKDYLSHLISNLHNSFNINSSLVSMEMECEDILLNLDISIPCGLILNELISNALKYAFPNNRKGKIIVSVAKQTDHIFMSVEDNGVGLPSDLDIKQAESLGLQLVDALIEQINGKIEIKSSPNGTKFIFSFKY